MRYQGLGFVTSLLWCLLPGAIDGRAADDLTQLEVALVVEGTDHDLGETPVVIEVDDRQIPAGRYVLQQDPGSPALAALVYRDQNRSWLGVVLPRVVPGTATKYVISHDRSPADPDRGVTLTAQGRRVAIKVDGKLWTNYVPDDGPKPFFDPLIGPSNLSLTRAWPMRDVAGEPHDHPHHRSLWFAHFDVNKANTWDENPGHGQILETSPPIIVGSGPLGIIRTKNDWLDRSGRKVCEDERVVRFYATTTARVFDYAVTLKATQGPIKIGDNKDGVFGVRVAAAMALTANQGGQITNSRGIKGKAAWGQAAEWVDYTGPIGGETMGIAILNHPGSFRFPTTWHVRDYGLFAANPFGWHDFGQSKSGDHTVDAGGSLQLAYRVVLHRGSTEQARVESQFQSYANPPQVTIR